MRKDVMECLIYADGDDDRGEELVSLLTSNGIRATGPVEPDEFFDLLAKRPWGCLVLTAEGVTGDLLDVLSQCRRLFPEVPPLVLVQRGDIDTAVRVMKAGAADCMETPVETGRLLTIVSNLCRQAGHAPVGSRKRLTRMERTVLGHLLEGRTNRKIAQVLCRSPRTIEIHRRHIMKKTGATNLVDLVKQMMFADEGSARPEENGLLSDAMAPGASETKPEENQEDR